MDKAQNQFQLLKVKGGQCVHVLHSCKLVSHGAIRRLSWVHPPVVHAESGAEHVGPHLHSEELGTIAGFVTGKRFGVLTLPTQLGDLRDKSTWSKLRR
jgi:hypothetical protein